MKKYILTLFLSLPSLLFGQGWEKAYGEIYDDFSWSVLQTMDGGYIMTGLTTSIMNNSRDIMLVKTDDNGNELWKTSYGGASNDYGVKVLQSTDGCYFIAGTTSSQGAGQDDMFLLKTDSQGNELWTKTYGSTNFEYCTDFTNLASGGYALTGLQRENGESDIFVVKVDSAGNEIWNNSYGGYFDDVGGSVIENSNGDLVITGSMSDSVSSGNFLELCVLKIDNLGNELWIKTFGGSGFEEGRSVVQTADHGYVICGTIRL
jgi:hypothetical protein